MLARLRLQSGMWLCLYCTCSCSPWGTVIWSWERAVRCGNGLWRSNNYPLPLCYKERGRNDMLRHQSSQKKKTEVSREQLDLWMELEVRVWRGQRRKKGRVWGKKKNRQLTQIRRQRRPNPVIWLEVFWTCWAWRGKHIIFCCIPSTRVSNQHWTPVQSLSQLIYLPVLCFLKLEDEG